MQQMTYISEEYIARVLIGLFIDTKRLPNISINIKILNENNTREAVQIREVFYKTKSR